MILYPPVSLILIVLSVIILDSTLHVFTLVPYHLSFLVGIAFGALGGLFFDPWFYHHFLKHRSKGEALVSGIVLKQMSQCRN